MSEQIIYQGYASNVLARISYDIDWEKTILITDPPYNRKYHYNRYADNLPPDEYWNSLVNIKNWFNQSCFIMYPEDLYTLAAYAKEIPTKVCSWVYNANTPKQHRDAAYFGIKPDFNLYKQPYKNMNDKRVQERYKKTGGARSYDWKEIQQVKNVNKNDAGTGIIHPCEMPVEIMKWLVGIIPKDYLVIDAFCGSGTTGVACVELDRNFIGIDLDEDYVKLAQARIDLALGKKNLYNNLQEKSVDTGVNIFLDK